jgi:hypothetical protein
MATVLNTQANEFRAVLAHARQVARFYTGKRVTSVEAVAVVLQRLDRAERQLADVRARLNGVPRSAA